MPRYRFKGLTLEGKMIRGSRFALSSQELEVLLLAERIALISSWEVRNPLQDRSINKLSLSLFFNYLSSLLKRGVPLVTALDFYVQQADDKTLATMVREIYKQVLKGRGFSESLALFPQTFSSMMVSLISVAEHAAALDEVCAALASYMQESHELQQSIKKIMLFPMITLFFAGSLLLMMLLFMVPQLASVFSSFDSAIPISTQRIIWLSQLLQEYGMLLLPFVGLLGFVIIKLFMITKKIKFLGERICLQLPLIGDCYRIVGLLVYLRSLLLLIKHGVPLKKSLEIIVQTDYRVILQREFGVLMTQLQQGQSFSDGVNALPSFYFDITTKNLLMLGEQAENMIPILEQVLDLLAKNVKEKLQRITILLHPVLLIFVGLFVTALLVTMYLPIFSLATALR